MLALIPCPALALMPGGVSFSIVARGDGGVVERRPSLLF